ncbi:hypothetical protein RJ639_034367 [Escallonia herrerae]|uniref:Uncharacterized protein n=1 Tax=Escallonia herrerae TaxID=1293975 RepID=A0AA89BJB2_9ASTE|nr:hypothetical protein RJ639_034367 [Escallonia herrerae]
MPQESQQYVVLVAAYSFVTSAHPWHFTGLSFHQEVVTNSDNPQKPTTFAEKTSHHRETLHQLGSSPHLSLRSLSRPHGPLMLLHLGSVPVLLVSSADGAREITKNHDLVFSKRPKATIPDRLLYGSRDVAFSPYGDYWRQECHDVRSICVLRLLSNKRVQSYDNVREEEAALVLKKIGKISSSCSLVNLSELFISLTNDTVCRVALGRKYSGGEGGRKLKELLEQFAELLGVFSIRDYIPWLGWVDKVKGLHGKAEKVAKEFDEFLEGVIKEHIDQNKGEKNGGESDDEVEGQDFVDILLEFQRENMNSSPIHVDTIKALILTGLFINCCYILLIDITMVTSETNPESGPVNPNMQHSGGTVYATPYVAPAHGSVGLGERPEKFNGKDFKR